MGDSFMGCAPLVREDVQDQSREEHVETEHVRRHDDDRDEHDDRVRREFLTSWPDHLLQLLTDLLQELAGARALLLLLKLRPARGGSGLGTLDLGALTALRPLHLSVHRAPCRGGGTRTPNRRFWRPVLYQVELRPSARPVLPEGGDSAAKYRAGPMVRQSNARRNGGRAPQVRAGHSDNRPVEARRPMALEAGLFVLIVALPLAFFPQSRDAFLDVNRWRPHCSRPGTSGRRPSRRGD